MTDLEKIEAVARRIVEEWIGDCGEGNLSLNFVQSELLQRRIVETLAYLCKHLPSPQVSADD